MNPPHHHHAHAQMATLTASLERSLRNFSLNDAAAASSSSAPRRRFIPDSSASTAATTLVELNSHISLPYHWEQCLDLKTGEIYYVNWRSGKKAKEDPRLKPYNYSDEEEEEDVNTEEGGSYESEGSWTSSSGSSRESYRAAWRRYGGNGRSPEEVLVVAGCKGCLMYHMVPKHARDCPKCSGDLLHIDGGNN